jgi:glutathionyl-hydroquinone reductase
MARTALEEISNDGEFRRKEAAWRHWISSEHGAKFPPEKGRYHLFVAYACPWAHRTLMVRALRGLEDAISITIVHPTWQRTKPDDSSDNHCGWVFGNPNGMPLANTINLGGPFPPAYPGNEPDPVFHSFSIREVYERAGDIDGKYTVPILWDKKLNTIVNNESSEIIKILNSELNDFAKYPHLDLNPSDMNEQMDNVDAWIYPNLNNGVYRCGFATSQSAYDKAITDLTAAFDKVDGILKTQRFIAGDALTLSDIRLFVTLLRFDEVYVVYFKTNTRTVTHTESILNYCREIYQMPGVAETVNMEQIKAHYFTSHPDLNHWSIIPKGMDFVQLLEVPHNRESLFPLRGALQ